MPDPQGGLRFAAQPGSLSPGGIKMSFTLVIGGAASGKSQFAETLITGPSRVYLATARVLDDEMEAKRRRHRLQRGPGWRTIEAPLDPAQALAALRPPDQALLDCVTMWLTNHLMAESDLDAAGTALVDALAQSPVPTVVVTNELGHGVVPADAMTRRFREAQGRVNIALAAAAARVCLVCAGLPLWIKGSP